MSGESEQTTHEDGSPDLALLLQRLGCVVFRRTGDDTLRFEYVRGRCTELIGLSAATLTGDAYSFWTQVADDDRRRVLSVLEEACREGGHYQLDYRLVSGSGRVHRVHEEGAAVSVHRDGAELVVLEGIIVAGGSGAAHALEGAADHRSRVLEGARFAILAFDLEGRITLAEGGGLPRGDWPLEEAVGRTVYEVFGGDAELLASCRRALEGEEFSVVTGRGGAVYETRFGPVRDAEGRLVGSVVVSSDVGQRGRALGDLRDSEERFRALAEHSGEIIAEVSADRRLLYASPRLCEVLGHAPGELLGTDPVELLHPEDRAQVLSTCTEAVARSEPAEVLCRLRREDGAWLWAELGGRAFRASSGELHGMVTGRDVDARVRVEEAFLSRRLAEARLGKLSRRFLALSSEEIEGAVEEGLEAAADIGHADRCSLLSFRGDSPSALRTFNWERPGMAPRRFDPDDPGGPRYRWARRQLASGEILRVARIEDLPDEAAELRSRLGQMGVRSYLAIPVRSDGRMVAVLTLQCVRSAHAWSEQEIALLRLVAELFGSALRRSEAEGALRDSEHRLRALIEGAQDAICEVRSDGSVVYANPRFFEMLGYDPDGAGDFNAHEMMHPEDLARVAEINSALGRGSLGSASMGGTMLYRGRHRDGSFRWLEANGHVFRTAAGEIHSTAVIRDVTDREAEHEQMELRLDHESRIADLARRILALGADEIDEGIREGLAWITPLSAADRSWLVTLDSEAEHFDQVYEWCAEAVESEAESLLGAPIDQFPTARELRAGREVHVPSLEALPADSPERAVMDARGAHSYLAIPLLSGPTLMGLLCFETVREPRSWADESIALLRLVGEIFVSALQRKQAEQALRESRIQLHQAQKMEAVGTLAGGVAHDFNNQLSVILGNARYVRGLLDEQAREEVEEALDDLERAGEHCAQLTRSLLAFSRHAPVSSQSIPVTRALADVRELIRPLVPSSIRFETFSDGEGDSVVADPTQLQQVLVNLAVNARDAMPLGGRLSISSGRRHVEDGAARRMGLPRGGEFVELLVEDTGVGIDEENLERIFEPFFTTKDPGKGTGLGLATVYGILRESGGTITVESTPGRGTSFRALLPRSVDASDAPATSELPEDDRSTVLLVEDEGGVRRLVRRMLEHLGYAVLEARDGVEALRASEDRGADPIDWLVTDVTMPRMGGAELAARILETRDETSVLLITGHAEEEIDVPGAGLLYKPFSERALEEALACAEGRD